jgi:hypothetical protein
MIDEDLEKVIIGEDYYLEHFGVAGMKWGQRRAQNRALNRASRQRDREKQFKEVTRARQNIKSGKTKADFKKAKSQFKQDKVNLGSREARKILNKAKEKRISEISKSNEAKNRKEAALMLAAVGGIALLRVGLQSRVAGG